MSDNEEMKGRTRWLIELYVQHLAKQRDLKTEDWIHLAQIGNEFGLLHAAAPATRLAVVMAMIGSKMCPTLASMAAASIMVTDWGTGEVVKLLQEALRHAAFAKIAADMSSIHNNTPQTCTKVDIANRVNAEAMTALHGEGLEEIGLPVSWLKRNSPSHGAVRGGEEAGAGSLLDVFLRRPAGPDWEKKASDLLEEVERLSRTCQMCQTSQDAWDELKRYISMRGLDTFPAEFLLWGQQALCTLGRNALDKAMLNLPHELASGGMRQALHFPGATRADAEGPRQLQGIGAGVGGAESDSVTEEEGPVEDCPVEAGQGPAWGRDGQRGQPMGKGKGIAGRRKDSYRAGGVWDQAEEKDGQHGADESRPPYYQAWRGSRSGGGDAHDLHPRALGAGVRARGGEARVRNKSVIHKEIEDSEAEGSTSDYKEGQRGDLVAAEPSQKKIRGRNQSQLGEDTSVLVKRRVDGKLYWEPGWVKKNRSDGTYDVAFENGENRTLVRRRDIVEITDPHSIPPEARRGVINNWVNFRHKLEGAMGKRSTRAGDKNIRGKDEEEGEKDGSESEEEDKEGVKEWSEDEGEGKEWNEDEEGEGKEWSEEEDEEGEEEGSEGGGKEEEASGLEDMEEVVTISTARGKGKRKGTTKKVVQDDHRSKRLQRNPDR